MTISTLGVRQVTETRRLASTGDYSALQFGRLLGSSFALFCSRPSPGSPVVWHSIRAATLHLAFMVEAALTTLSLHGRGSRALNFWNKHFFFIFSSL